MENIIDLLIEITKTYNEKAEENEYLLNSKNAELEKIESEIKNNRIESSKKINYLKQRLERYQEEEKQPYDIEEPSFDEVIEQEYENKLKELNAKLIELNIRKDELSNDLNSYLNYKEQLREAFIQYKTDPNCVPVADVVGKNFDRKYADKIEIISRELSNLTDEIKKIESEIAKLKLDRYTEFGKETPIVSSKREQLNDELKKEYWKKESEIIDEIKKVEEETQTIEEALINSYNQVLAKPDFSKVYLKEMFELKSELISKILEPLKIKVNDELKTKNDSENEIINPILEVRNKKLEERNHISSKLSETSSKLSENSDSIGIMKELIEKYSKISNDITSLESKTLVDIEPLEKEIDRLGQCIELIDKTSNLLGVTDEEVSANEAAFTKEEQDEYDRRQLKEIDRFNKVLPLANVLSIREENQIEDEISINVQLM